MQELQEIEELFKNEELAKNRSMVQALLRNAAILHDKGATDIDRQRATANIKAITQGKQAKPKKQKVVDTATPVSAVAQPAASVTAPTEIPFHEEFATHHGVDPVKFKAAFDAMTPEQAQLTRDYHTNALKTKMNKSLTKLSDLFKQLNKALK